MARRNPLLPDYHKQKDFFVCDIVDAVPKGDMGSMEHPVFTLSTKPDMKPREYRNGDTFLKINPSIKGLATVHDRDVLIYCISQCISALNEGRQVNRKVHVKAYDLLKATNRTTSGRSYQLLKDTLQRLQGTQIETNITQGGKERYSLFGLVDKATATRETRDGRMQDIEITLSDWIFDAIENQHVLTLSRDYFRLRSPIERRLYELARKHCGKQKKWQISLENLLLKAGSQSKLKEFKRMVGKFIANQDHFPEYRFEMSDNLVTIYPKKKEKQVTVLPILLLSNSAIEEGKQYAAGWDVYALQEEWKEWVLEKGINVKNPDNHFVSFCKQHGPHKDRLI
jgi:plasmid replication initiation protein